jgi:hypothetical protein
MTVFHHKLLTRVGMALASGWIHPLSKTMFVHLFITSVIQKVSIVTLDVIGHLISYLVYRVLLSGWCGHRYLIWVVTYSYWSLNWEVYVDPISGSWIVFSILMSRTIVELIIFHSCDWTHQHFIWILNIFNNVQVRREWPILKRNF